MIRKFVFVMLMFASSLALAALHPRDLDGNPSNGHEAVYDDTPPFDATNETGPGGGTLTVPCDYTSNRGVILGEFRIDDTAGKSRGIFVGPQISP